MCNPVPACGTRCIKCTKPHYTALIDAMDTTAATSRLKLDNGAKARSDARKAFTAQTPTGTENHMQVVANYAATTVFVEKPSPNDGAEKIAADIERYKRIGDKATANWLTTCLRTGNDWRNDRATSREAIKDAEAKAKRAATGSSNPLRRDPLVLSGRRKSIAEVYPGIAERWDRDHPGNLGILPHEVAQSANVKPYLKCPEGHSWGGPDDEYRINNINRPILAGKRYYPICPQCDGRNPAKFTRKKAELGALVDVLGEDLNVFNALSPASKYEVLQALNVIDGTVMGNTVGMALVNDISLHDMWHAKNQGILNGKLEENLTESGALSTISEATTRLNDDTTTPHDFNVDEALAAAGVLDLLDPTSDLADSIVRSTAEHFWTHAYLMDSSDAAFDFTGYCNLVASKRTGRPADAAIDRFLTEADAVRSFTLPTGYQTQRMNKFGEPVTLNPDLSQRRFAVLLQQRRRFMNFSGVGAGKTLATSLAVQNLAPAETLVVCPGDLRKDWITEFEAGYPGRVEVIKVKHLTDLTAPRPTAPGINRVWVVNYEKFSYTTPRKVINALAPFAQRVEAVIFDEIHKAKATTDRESKASMRRQAIAGFIRKASDANPDLIVVGVSATPVVNNLVEAKSLLELVQGTAPAFQTTPTIRNAITAHRHIAAAGVRRVMAYPTRLATKTITIDVFDQMQAITDRVTQYRTTDGVLGPNDASYWERALLPAKLPSIVKIALRRKTNNEGPTLIYTHFTTGMTDQITAALTDAGLTYGTFTGEETPAERAENLRRFRAREIDVLVGSQPIGTGVDGLQHVCNEMVVASMPWTAADDDQVSGRLFRRGQTRDVTITYVLTEAKFGKKAWSWCHNNRYARIRFKRDIANAAVDGALPAGVLESQDASAEKTGDVLAAILAKSKEAKSKKAESKEAEKAQRAASTEALVAA